MTTTTATKIEVRFSDLDAIAVELQGYTLADAQRNISAAIRWANGLRHSPQQGLYLSGVNEKLEKGAGALGWKLYGLTLAPAKIGGVVVCETAVDERLGCVRFGCLMEAGGGRYKNVYAARQRRTRMLANNPCLFVSLMLLDIEMVLQMARVEGKRVGYRANILSDIAWEEMIPWLFGEFPLVQFYDYTKEMRRLDALAEGRFPSNYHLTFSAHEKMREQELVDILRGGGNVAVVFAKEDAFKKKASNPLPSTFLGWPVIDGDDHDMRFMDPPGCVIGLRAKSRLAHNVNATKTGFVNGGGAT